MTDSSVQNGIEDEAEAEEALPFRYTIGSYGADYPVDGLVKRLSRDDIFIPHFQRNYVWKLPQASRFVESLLLGLPVPGVFLGKQDRTKKLLIIDGQQRLLTLKYFYDGIFSDSGKQFALTGVKEQLEGLTYKSLEEEQRRTLDDSIIHATIVKQEDPSDDDSGMYLVFERLNTGGTALSAQEIRTCVSYGPFVEFLKELNKLEDWRTLVGAISARMKDVELILRFFALLEDSGRYQRPMKGFLNEYMAKMAQAEEQRQEPLRQAFTKTVHFLGESIGRSTFRPKAAVNAAVLDAVMIGTCRRLDQGAVDRGRFKAAYEALLGKKEFIAAYTQSTADEAQVETRIRLACETLSAA